MPPRERRRLTRCDCSREEARRRWRQGRPAGDDPWQGHTLEWATSSPPPRYNFAALPAIRSYAPLLDLRESREAVAS